MPPESYGNLLQHFTGSKQHNVALREDAVRRGLSVSEYGVTEVETGESTASRARRSVYAFLGYAYIPPELREAAASSRRPVAGALPRLVELGDLRGDLHMHTTWSDGKDTLEEMVGRGQSAATRTSRSATTRTGCASEQARARSPRRSTRSTSWSPVPDPQGVEVEHPADGTLDVADDELATLDWVVASIALRASTTTRPSAMLAAMENPYVDCIGHPTGRKIGKRAAGAGRSRACDREGARDRDVRSR